MRPYINQIYDQYRGGGSDGDSNSDPGSDGSRRPTITESSSADSSPASGNRQAGSNPTPGETAAPPAAESTTASAAWDVAPLVASPRGAGCSGHELAEQQQKRPRQQQQQPQQQQEQQQPRPPIPFPLVAAAVQQQQQQRQLPAPPLLLEAREEQQQQRTSSEQPPLVNPPIPFPLSALSSSFPLTAPLVAAAVQQQQQQRPLPAPPLLLEAREEQQQQRTSSEQPPLVDPPLQLPPFAPLVAAAAQQPEEQQQQRTSSEQPQLVGPPSPLPFAPLVPAAADGPSSTKFSPVPASCFGEDGEELGSNTSRSSSPMEPSAMVVELRSLISPKQGGLDSELSLSLLPSTSPSPRVDAIESSRTLAGLIGRLDA